MNADFINSHLDSWRNTVFLSLSAHLALFCTKLIWKAENEKRKREERKEVKNLKQKKMKEKILKEKWNERK